MSAFQPAPSRRKSIDRAYCAPNGPIDCAKRIARALYGIVKISPPRLRELEQGADATVEVLRTDMQRDEHCVIPASAQFGGEHLR